MAKFHVPLVPYLWMPEAYSGEWVGWMELPIRGEREARIGGRLLGVRCPYDPAVMWYYRRDVLERDGRAWNVCKAGAPAGNGAGCQEAFVPGQWKAILDSRGRAIRYQPLPQPVDADCDPFEGDGIAQAWVSTHGFEPDSIRLHFKTDRHGLDHSFFDITDATALHLIHDTAVCVNTSGSQPRKWDALVAVVAAEIKKVRATPSVDR